LAVTFQRRITREAVDGDGRTRAIRLLYVLYAVLLFITIRIIFRLIEYSHGIYSSIPNHEVYMYIFDSTPMFFATLLFNIVHPGKYMPGKESDLPSRKEYRREKKQRKEAAGLTPPAELEMSNVPENQSHTYFHDVDLNV
jgi:hypothetical protein